MLAVAEASTYKTRVPNFISLLDLSRDGSDAVRLSPSKWPRQWLWLFVETAAPSMKCVTENCELCWRCSGCSALCHQRLRHLWENRSIAGLCDTHVVELHSQHRCISDVQISFVCKIPTQRVHENETTNFCRYQNNKRFCITEFRW